MSIHGPRRALFLSRDPGSVRAMLPVAKVLAGPAGWSVTALGLPPTFAQVRDGLVGTSAAVEEIDAAAWQAAPADVLDTAIAHHRPHVVVSGSSPALGPPPETPEQHLIVAARRAGVPSVGILDFWGFYRERFVGTDGRVDPALIPDRLCVLDRLCRDDLIALGLPADRLVTTHNPGLDALVQRHESRVHSKAAAGPCFLFASQPLAENSGQRGWSVDQYDLFDRIRRCMALSVRASLVVVPHPRENRAAWRDHLASCGFDSVRLAEPGEASRLVAMVDLLVTSHSSLSYQAALCDTPVLSFRPFEWIREPPVVDRLGLARFAGDEATLAALLREFDPPAERARMVKLRHDLAPLGLFYSDGCATDRVVAEIRRLVADW